MTFSDGLLAACQRFGLDTMKAYGLTEASFVRAMHEWISWAKVPAGSDLSDDGMLFVWSHSIGEASALKRVQIALSDPRARGVEQAVIEHLADGLEIEDALRKANAGSAPTGKSEDGGTVVPFRRS